MNYRLEIIDLSCARGDRPLFSGLSRTVRAGDLLHVVGSNGSGKTTLLRTLCGLSRPLDGEVRWQGQSIRSAGDEYRRCLAYVGHVDGIQGELTAVENLDSLRCLVSDDGNVVTASAASPASSAAFKKSLSPRASHRAARIDAVLERMGLATRRSLPAKVLSHGQKRRLALSRLLTSAKPLWILDEPFTALDVNSCRLVNELLTEHLAGGGIAILSSHQRLELPGISVGTLNLDDARAGAFDVAAETPTYPAERDTA